MMRRIPRDPRWLQLAVLGSLIVYGISVLGFPLSVSRVAATVAGALVTQRLLSWWFTLSRFDPKSALITAFSLTLLLRTPDHITAFLAAAIAIASKFLIRSGRRHIFNPANFAIVFCLATGSGWVAPGQWGSVALFALVLGGCGVFVVARSARADVTIAFLVVFAALAIGRGVWLGDPLRVAWHGLQSGAVILFAFFMLSDPKTTPDSRTGRLVFAALVATLAFAIQWSVYRSDAVMWALAALAPLTPALNRLLPGARHRWPSSPLDKTTSNEGSSVPKIGLPSRSYS